MLGSRVQMLWGLQAIRIARDGIRVEGFRLLELSCTGSRVVG